MNQTNDKQKAEQYRQAAEQGDAEAMCKLGWCYFSGRGIPKNQAEAEKCWKTAVEIWKKAAEQGNTEAQYKLGRLCAPGVPAHGIPCDALEATQWLRKAAEKGHAGAQHHLSICYYLGIGVPKDMLESVQWLRKVAEQDDDLSGVAAYELGKCYIHGWGVPQDIIEAEKWLRAAAQTREDENIDTMLTLIELTRKQIERSCYPADER